MARNVPPPSAPPSLPAPFVHPTAVVDAGVTLSPGVKVWHFAHVCAGAHLGEGVVLGHAAYVGPGVRIGRGSRIQNHVSVFDGVVLEEDVFVGPGAVFTNVKNPRSHVSRKDEFLPTLVRRRATVGANATVVCGVTLGEACFVAAGAVVTRDVPSRVLVRGAPARAAGFACDCGEVLGKAGGLVCRRCGAAYAPAGDGGVVPKAAR